MKVRKITHGLREAIQRRWSRKHMRRAHRAVRRFAAKPENVKYKDMITLTMLLMAGRQERAYKRFLKQSRRPSYRRRQDRLFAEQRRTGGRIVHDWRGSRVVPREPQ